MQAKPGDGGYDGYMDLEIDVVQLKIATAEKLLRASQMRYATVKMETKEPAAMRQAQMEVEEAEQREKEAELRLLQTVLAKRKPSEAAADEPPPKRIKMEHQDEKSIRFKGEGDRDSPIQLEETIDEKKIEEKQIEEKRIEQDPKAQEQKNRLPEEKKGMAPMYMEDSVEDFLYWRCDWAKAEAQFKSMPVGPARTEFEFWLLLERSRWAWDFGSVAMHSIAKHKLAADDTIWTRRLVDLAVATSLKPVPNSHRDAARKRVQEALPQLQQEAGEGWRAAYLLGRIAFIGGLGVFAQDLQSVRRGLERLRDEGHGGAKHMLMMDSKGEAKINLVELAVCQRYPPSLVCYANMMSNSHSAAVYKVPENKSECVRLLRAASAQGYTTALWDLLTELSAASSATAAQDAEVVRLLRQAANEGFSQAREELQYMAPNLPKLGVLQRAEAAESAEAALELGLLYLEGKVMPAMKDKAVALLRKAAASSAVEADREKAKKALSDMGAAIAEGSL